MIWAEIKKAINSTLGTSQFKPLNEAIKQNINSLQSSVEGNLSELQGGVDELQDEIVELRPAIRNEVYEGYYDFFLTQQDLGATSVADLLVVPRGEEISSAAYSNHSAIRIILPNTCYTIGREAFAFCLRLLRIALPDSVGTVGNLAFYNCEKLNEVVIGTGVGFIGQDAFANCYDLERVFYKGTEEQWAKIQISSGNTYLTNAEIYFNA